MTLLLGLGLGGGLAFLVDMMDTSYRRPEDLTLEFEMPVLITLPFRYSENEIKRRKRREILTLTSIALAFALSGFGIVFALKGFDPTMRYVKDFISGLPF